MKFLHQSATEAFTEGDSVERFIYLDGPERGPEVLSEAELREAAIHQTTLDQLAHHALTEAIAKHEMGRYDIAEGPEGVFRINENSGAIQVYVDGWGNNNRYLNVLAATDLQNGVMAEEILAALQGAPEIEAILNPPVIEGRRDRTRRVAAAGVIPVGEGDDVGAERIPVGEPVVENFSDAIDKNEINTALAGTDIEERVVAIERDELTGNYLVTLNEGAPLTILAAEAGSAEALQRVILDGLGMFDEEIDAAEAEALAPTVQAIIDAYGAAANKGEILTQVNDAMGYARGSGDRITRFASVQDRLATDPALRVAFGEALGLTAAVAEPDLGRVEEPVDGTEVVDVPAGVLDLDAMDDSDILDLVDSLDGLTGEALQNRINELADQLGLTFPEGRYVENGRLVVDGSVGRTTREAQRQVVEYLESNIPEEADHYISVLNDLENATDVDEIMNALSGNQVQARMLQRDLTLLGFYNGGIDGVLGAGSRRGLTAALADERFENVYQIETAAREAEVVAEGERHGRRNPSVDALMTKIREEGTDSITAADVAFTGRENGGSADRTREVMDFIEQAVAAGDIAQTDASRILELMMAEDSYPEDMEMQDRIAATLHDSSSRFIVGLSSINPETRIREVSVALRNRIRGRESRAQLAADMMANNGVPAQSFGAVDYHADGADPIVEIDGQEFDMRTLTKMYIITGGGETAQGTGAVEVPIGPMSSRLNVHNLVYRDGALVGTMENGCEGNLVVIPVNRQYVRYVPPAPAPRGPRVTIEPDPETPVEGGRIINASGCNGTTHWIQYRYPDGHLDTEYEHNSPLCEDGDGDGCNGCDAGSGADDSEGTGGDGL